jgi:hypothetical protein
MNAAKQVKVIVAAIAESADVAGGSFVALSALVPAKTKRGK